MGAIEDRFAIDENAVAIENDEVGAGFHRRSIAVASWAEQRDTDTVGDYANIIARPLSDACLIASTRRCRSTEVAKSGRSVSPPPIARAKRAYICPTFIGSPS